MHAGAQSNPAAGAAGIIAASVERGGSQGVLGGMEARFAGGVCLLLVAIGTSACAGVISPPPVPKIYVADASNNHIVRMDDMTGAGWTGLGSLAAGSSKYKCSFRGAVFG